MYQYSNVQHDRQWIRRVKQEEKMMLGDALCMEDELDDMKKQLHHYQMKNHYLS